MITYSPDDISYDLAYRAHYNTSFSPERRAQEAQAGYVQDIERRYAELSPLATTDELTAILDAEMERYKAGYIKLYSALLHAESRCFSSMIVGLAGFNNRRHAKANERAHKRLDEFQTWYEKAQRAIVKRLTDAGKPAEDKPDGEIVVLFAADGVQVVDNPTEERIQILFDGKPGAAMRDKLKKAGWRWSPTNNAWQRQRTGNAKYSALQMVRDDTAGGM